MRYLPDVFKVFPDMQLVWMHHDPLKTVSSAGNRVGIILWLRSDQQMSEAAAAQIINPAGLASMFDNVIEQMETGVIPPQRMPRWKSTCAKTSVKRARRASITSAMRRSERRSERCSNAT